MAFVAQDDKQNLNNGQAPGSQVVGSGTGTFAGNAGGASTSTQPSTAGVGAGGSNGWTNIQSYLNANQGSTGSADALNKTAGGAFNQEQSNLDQSSKQATDKANQEVQKTNIGQDQASQMITEMGNNYNYNGQQNQTYNQDLSKFQTGLNSTYGGPTSYSYGMGADAQRYGQALGNDQGFQGLMSGLYNRAAGGLMNQGQLSLQQNLDTNNSALNQARQNLTSQYAGLQNNVNNTVQSTDAAVRAAQQQYGQNQRSLHDYLMGQENQNMGAVQSALDAYNGQEQAMKSQLGQTENFVRTVGPQQSVLNSYISKDPFYNYQARNTSADLSTVGGVDDQRNRYNAIAQALGVGGLIDRGADAQHSSLSFNQAAYDAAKHTNPFDSHLWRGDPNSHSFTFIGDPNTIQNYDRTSF